MAVERPIDETSHVYLIDGSGYIFRAYHALPPLTRSDGTPVGAVQGFCNMLWKLLEDLKGEDQPSHLAVIFDHSGKSFRNDMYDLYKANRPPAPEDLVPQFSIIRDATRAFGTPCIEKENYEADDLIGRQQDDLFLAVEAHTHRRRVADLDVGLPGGFAGGQVEGHDGSVLRAAGWDHQQSADLQG